MTCRLWRSSLVVRSWISMFRCSFPRPLELLGMLPWTVSCQQFPATPFMHNMIMSTVLQFPATPLRLVVSIPHWRTRFWVLDSVLDHVPLAAVSRGSFDNVSLAVSRGSFARPLIYMRIPRDIGNTRTRRRGLTFVQAC